MNKLIERFTETLLAILFIFVFVMAVLTSCSVSKTAGFDLSNQQYDPDVYRQLISEARQLNHKQKTEMIAKLQKWRIDAIRRRK